MELTIKTDEEALVAYAYKICKTQISPKLIHDDNRVWIKSEYRLHKNTYVFDPEGKMLHVHFPAGC